MHAGSHPTFWCCNDGFCTTGNYVGTRYTHFLQGLSTAKNDLHSIVINIKFYHLFERLWRKFTSHCIEPRWGLSRSLVALHPVVVAYKCRLQVSTLHILICLSTFAVVHGRLLARLYRFHLQTIRRLLPGRQRRDPDDRPPLSNIAVDAGFTILAGGFAGIVMWATVLPVDSAKTRVQIARKGSLMDGTLMQ